MQAMEKKDNDIRSNQASVAKFLEGAIFVAVILASLYVCWLFSLAYPDGLITEETRTYQTLVDSFHWLTSNSLDWCATVPFGAILVLSRQFENPTNAIYSLNALIFSLNVGLIFILGRSLLGSLSMGVLLSMGSLFFEIATMRIFYSNLQAAADPFFTEVTFLGVLLALTGWLRKRPSIFIAAYCVLGLATFIKPAGVVYVPLWVVFAVLAWRGHKEIKQKMAIICASVLLVIAPLSIWSLRNFYVYGYMKASALGGSSLLRVVLPILANNDKVFDNPKVNAEFITNVRGCERLTQLSIAEDAPLAMRSMRNEEYFIYGDAPLNPFLFLANRVHPDWTGNRHVIFTLPGLLFFQLDAISGPLAIRIIEAHPAAYLRRVAREYAATMNPMEIALNPWEKFGGEPQVAYDYWMPRVGPREPNFLLYPHKGFPRAMNSGSDIAKGFKSFYDNPLVAAMRTQYFTYQLLISHVIFVAAVITCAYCQTSRKAKINKSKIQMIAIVLIMLFLNGAALDLTVAMFQVAKSRYALAAEPEFHLMLTILVVCGIQFVGLWLSKLVASKASDNLQPNASV